MHVLHVCQFRVIFYYMHFKDTLYHRVFHYLSASHTNISSEEVTLAKTSVPLNFYWVPLLISSTPRVLIPTPSYPYSIFPSKFTPEFSTTPPNLLTCNASASHHGSGDFPPPMVSGVTVWACICSRLLQPSNKTRRGTMWVHLGNGQVDSPPRQHPLFI